MENTDFKFMGNVGTSSSSSSIFSSFDTKTLLIIILAIILFFSLLGINVFIIIGNLINTLVAIFGPLILNILSLFGYTTGGVLGKTAGVVGDTTQTGIEVAEGTVQSFGDVLKDISRLYMNPDAASRLDAILDTSPNKWKWYQSGATAGPDNTGSPIQSTHKGGWCLVGEYNGTRGCVAVGDQDKCMSGQLFPDQAACLNPAQTTPFPGQLPPVPSAMGPVTNGPSSTANPRLDAMRAYGEQLAAQGTDLTPPSANPPSVASQGVTEGRWN